MRSGCGPRLARAWPGPSWPGPSWPGPVWSGPVWSGRPGPVAILGSVGFAAGYGAPIAS